jgi:hypothetical protein
MVGQSHHDWRGDFGPPTGHNTGQSVIARGVTLAPFLKKATMIVETECEHLVLFTQTWHQKN